MAPSDPEIYQVIVSYRDARAPTWYSPWYVRDSALDLYGREANRISSGGIEAVYLCKLGVIVAQATS